MSFPGSLRNLGPADVFTNSVTGWPTEARGFWETLSVLFHGAPGLGFQAHTHSCILEHVPDTRLCWLRQYFPFIAVMRFNIFPEITSEKCAWMWNTCDLSKQGQGFLKACTHTRAHTTYICALGYWLEGKEYTDHGISMMFPMKGHICVPLWCHTRVVKSTQALRPFLLKGIGWWPSSCCSCWSVLVGGDEGGSGFCYLIHEPSAHGGLDIKARILVEKEFNH